MPSRYAAIQPPLHVDLRDAPVMRDWLIDPERDGDGAVLVGLVDGRRRTTGSILAYDCAEGWCLTWTGLFRLGQPLDPSVPSADLGGGE